MSGTNHSEEKVVFSNLFNGEIILKYNRKKIVFKSVEKLEDKIIELKQKQ